MADVYRARAVVGPVSDGTRRGRMRTDTWINHVASPKNPLVTPLTTAAIRNLMN